MNTYSQNLIKARDILGSFEAVGKVCGTSGKAVMKWRNKGKPPRTEYTGETRYAESIERATEGKIPALSLLPVLR
jgi:predicted secreted protein